MMAPVLKVSVGPNTNELREITYNDNSSHAIQSQSFDGLVCVNIKGFKGGARAQSGNETYFSDPSRATRTWSIRIQGRFLQEINGNDVLFGNIFDRPLNLPWGFSAALNLVQYIDPTLEHDLSGDSPWALSPLLSTMPFLQRTRLVDDALAPTSIPHTPLAREQSEPALAPALQNESSPKARRKYFENQENRKAVTLGPRDLIQADFVHGYLQFPSLTFALPAGMQFDLMSYYDERPVHFICKKRGTDLAFFVVSFVVLKNGDVRGETSITPVDTSEID
ncbi:hypothetical protein CTheo_1867 [Ceratobasidium theobromae]|uniref:Domain of unknown function at the cortex 1 domain-containing protein n=1 Tax=Ceratobasidium theobromae TaxID=1582974 RepID=A0A5N5QSK3_9AGAM|nr:hypothetical protein CTheo_1867 [Ceratobasidium theobromae]